MDYGSLPPEEQAKWKQFEREAKRRRETIGRMAAIVGLPPLPRAELNHVARECPCCGLDANRHACESLYEDDAGNYYRAADVYRAIVAKFAPPPADCTATGSPGAMGGAMGDADAPPPADATTMRELTPDEALKLIDFTFGKPQADTPDGPKDGGA